MPRPTFTNDYAADGKDLRAATRAESGHRCVRCGHPYTTGIKRADRGMWSACDQQCTHGGIVQFRVHGKPEWTELHLAGPVWTRFNPRDTHVEAKWRILTVHHFDGDKANDRWWNHLPLCQKCHLQFQNKVDPNVPYFFEHSEWLKPFVAGFYAKKYEGADLTREQVNARLDELLGWECKIPNDSRATRILAASDRGGDRQFEARSESEAYERPDRYLPDPDLGSP